MNNWIWGAGLGMQVVLLWVLVHRRITRYLPLFTTLIGLYVFRSVFLYAGFGHISGDMYSLSYDALSLLDVVMQVLVAWELFCAWQEERIAGRALDRMAAFAGLVVAAAAVAWGISRAVPAAVHTPIDRGVLLPSVLMLLVLGVREMRPTGAATAMQRAARRVLVGFAVLAAAGIASQVGRTVAALHREARLYLRWTYMDAFAYLVVLLFWLIALSGQRRRTEPRPAEQERPAML